MGKTWTAGVIARGPVLLVLLFLAAACSPQSSAPPSHAAPSSPSPAAAEQPAASNDARVGGGPGGGNDPSDGGESAQLGSERRPTSAAMPHFPWPPPQPSDRMALPRGRLFIGLGASPTLLSISDRLTDALMAAGYSEFSFFTVPGGFAVVARLEQFAADGSPQPQGLRFLDPNMTAPFSLAAYVRQLFLAPEGYYRLIVFVVTDQPFAATGAAPMAQTAEHWLQQGADRLPGAFARTPLTRSDAVSALIYEFRKHGSDAIATLEPGRLDARTHLIKSGLYDRLVGGR